jgi:hypothetical protein
MVWKRIQNADSILSLARRKDIAFVLNVVKEFLMSVENAAVTDHVLNVVPKCTGKAHFIISSG